MSRELVERAQKGDRAAYEELATGVTRQLFMVASRIVRDRDAAEEAVQQTLVAIWRDLPSLRDPDRFEAWAYRTVVRFCQSALRRQRRLGITIVDLSESVAGSNGGLEDVERRDQLEPAFRALSSEHRTVVVLHHYVGMSLGDIAEILDVPYGTVGSRLHHAMRAMRATIDAGNRATVTGGQSA
ncbi:MAG: RNA polymerase sigma factor [Chloroflexota bacterium]